MYIYVLCRNCQYSVLSERANKNLKSEKSLHRRRDTLLRQDKQLAREGLLASPRGKRSAAHSAAWDYKLPDKGNASSPPKPAHHKQPFSGLPNKAKRIHSTRPFK